MNWEDLVEVIKVEVVLWLKYNSVNNYFSVDDFVHRLHVVRGRVLMD